MYDRMQVERLIELWFAEDIGHGDLTANLMIDENATSNFNVNAREAMTVAGIDILAMVFRRAAPTAQIEITTQDGTLAEPGTTLARIAGPARALLTAERTALNITQHLSGIATQTARFVAEIAGTRAAMVDTRKTTPGLRMLEKHAVTCGGGRNHRLGLDSGIMLKDNHIAVCGSITAAVARARRSVPILTRIEVECDRLEQVAEAIESGCDIIMMDNMNNADMRTAVTMIAGRAITEASGGVRFETVRGIAETGVDFISCSRLTQAAPAVDIGLDAP